MSEEPAERRSADEVADAPPPPGADVEPTQPAQTPGPDDAATAFRRLHPAVRHHVVNSLRWPSLRPLQATAVRPLLEGEDAILLAPTAGGKTEASMLPTFSRMLSEPWAGLSVLYVCPIKALLNNLHERLAGYAGLLGRTAGLWHGDIGDGERRRMRMHPPDVLMTTPESIEAQLVGGKTDERIFFGDVRTVVIDEVHAFAGDDRGWHLLGVLSRLEHLAGRPIQRIGLSATVGNPQDLLSWLSPPGRPGRVIDPGGASGPIDLALDHVGDLKNASTIVARMHRGLKRLVFCDARAKVEEMAGHLRELKVSTYVSHSSLGLVEREDAEQAFAESRNCVIVATSTLELGLDVGDLDHVVQVDAPTTVAGFLQRVGRTGRRAGTHRNGMLLATRSDEVVKAAALIRLVRRGFIEPVVPPPDPVHVLAQQIMGLILQQKGLSRATWLAPLERFLEQAGLSEEDGLAILDHMEQTGLLASDSGVLWFGEEGERAFGRRNFMDLMAVFAEEPLLTVRHGRHEIGKVPPVSLGAQGREQAGDAAPGDSRETRDDRLPLLLGGRAWQILEIDWRKKVVTVQPAKGAGRARWLGDARPLSLEFCRACREVITDDRVDDEWTTRARDAIALQRAEMSGLSPDGTTLQLDRMRQRATWWTFGGLLANQQLASWVHATFSVATKVDNLSIQMDAIPDVEGFASAVRDAAANPPAFDPSGPMKLAEKLKFRQALPRHLLTRHLAERYGAQSELISVLGERVQGWTISMT